RNNYIHGYQQKDTRPKTHKAETFIRPKIHYQEINESESKMFSIDRTVKRYNVYKTDEHWLDEKKNFRKSYMGRTTITDDNVFDFYLDD
ncbi:MAG: hypothetical protein K9G34_11040, partial [Melioribacteraceae bacterium]|nr:hypothetical protein [Melioribacteraceae bacterium]